MLIIFLALHLRGSLKERIEEDEEKNNVVTPSIQKRMMFLFLLENTLVDVRRACLVSDDEHKEEYCLCCHRSLAVAREYTSGEEDSVRYHRRSEERSDVFEI